MGAAVGVDPNVNHVSRSHPQECMTIGGYGSDNIGDGANRDNRKIHCSMFGVVGFENRGRG